MFDNERVKGGEFLRLDMRADTEVRPYKKTASAIRRAAPILKELGPGLLADMCKQLGIRTGDL